MKKLLYVLALIMIAAGLQGYVEYGPSQPKEVALTDIESLRELPGPDGCMPHTYRPPTSYKGVDFPGVCDSASML